MAHASSVCLLILTTKKYSFIFMLTNQLTIGLYLIAVLQLIYLSWTDIKSRIIGNRVIISLFFTMVALSWLKYEQVFVLQGAIGLAVCFILFMLKVMGGGDAKLIAVLMLSIPPAQLISFFFLTAVFGLLLIIIGWLFFRQSIKQKGLPYGVAISSGYLATLWLFAS
ncbi:unknown [[Mannheimia] succiniciproducens MBEL55E]|uniref:Prepilin type IV endopeptidase peptidase domain-containing protein n=2 Tax=Basfia TaxID=697331 RepID=Q65RM2_MANSM|nr:unknown [[Mannheimia] succiniciproducens MBEL55E]